MSIRNIPLEKQARAIAAAHEDKGAIIITYGDDGFRIGMYGLSSRETQDALCVGIHHNFNQMDIED